MSFYRRDETGKVIRNPVVVDCSNEEILTEQNHKGSVDINEIVAKTGVDRIAETANVMALSFDTNPYNNFQEMMEMVAKGNSAFESLPAQTRDEFDNSPAKYMDYLSDPGNKDDLVKRGWLEPPAAPPAPVEVIVTNPTPPITETPPE